MARDAAPVVGMDRKEIRHMLRIAAGLPLHAAVALSQEAKAVIVLDRHKPPRTLERELREALPGSRLYRFGTMQVTAEEPQLARFLMNRSGPGLARKLAIALRGTGLRRVEIGTEDGRAPEQAEDEEPEEAAQIFAIGRRGDRPRHEALHDALKALIARVAQVGRARRLQLIRLAEAATAELRHERLDAAETAIAALRGALEGGG